MEELYFQGMVALHKMDYFSLLEGNVSKQISKYIETRTMTNRENVKDDGASSAEDGNGNEVASNSVSETSNNGRRGGLVERMLNVTTRKTTRVKRQAAASEKLFAPFITSMFGNDKVQAQNELKYPDTGISLR
jgi:hypothetical protein